MPWPTHYLITFRGTLGNPPIEIWSTSLRLSRQLAGTSDYDLDQGDLDDLANDFGGFLEAGFFGSEVKFTEARAYKIGADGRTVGDVLYSVLATPRGGVAGAPAHPWQCTPVLSFRTNVQRGPASRGRMYLPPVRIPVDAGDGKMSSAARDALLEQCRQFIVDANNRPGIEDGTGNVSVVSPRAGGKIADVNRLRMGRVFDTMRSRRNALLEDYADTQSGL